MAGAPPPRPDNTFQLGQGAWPHAAEECIRGAEQQRHCWRPCRRLGLWRCDALWQILADP
eukprot:4296991-Prymnesium_polylepis.1